MEDTSSKKQEIPESSETECNMAAPQHKAVSSEDQELDELLDSALEDFSKETVSRNVSENQSSATTESPSCVQSDQNDQEDLFNGVFQGEAQKQFQTMMKALAGDNPEMFENFDKLAMAAAQTGDNPEQQQNFEHTLQQTLSSMTQNTQQLQSEPSEDELMRMLGGMGLGAGGLGAEGEAAGGDMADFMPMMQTMMKSILSKDVLYPSLKDISTKYPLYLAENKEKLNSKDLSNYTRQHEIMERICVEFEAEQDSDSETMKAARLDRIMDLMEQMRGCGQPPTELVGDMPPGFDNSMFGAGSGLPTPPDQCLIM